MASSCGRSQSIEKNVFYALSSALHHELELTLELVHCVCELFELRAHLLDVIAHHLMSR